MPAKPLLTAEAREAFFTDYRTGYHWGRTGKELPEKRSAAQFAGYLAGKAEQRRHLERLTRYRFRR